MAGLGPLQGRAALILPARTAQAMADTSRGCHGCASRGGPAASVRRAPRLCQPWHPCWSRCEADAVLLRALAGRHRGDCLESCLVQAAPAPLTDPPPSPGARVESPTLDEFVKTALRSGLFA